MKNSTAQKALGWQEWGKLGRRFSRPEHTQRGTLLKSYPCIQRNQAEIKEISYPEDMVPYWGSPKVNVEVCVAIFHSH